MKHKSPELAFALRFAAVAADEILPRFQRCPVETKADGSVVNDADRRAEAVMRALIRAILLSRAIRVSSLIPPWRTSSATGTPISNWLEHGHNLIHRKPLPLHGKSLFLGC
jgi:hypothetical protein